VVRVRPQPHRKKYTLKLKQAFVRNIGRYLDSAKYKLVNKVEDC